MMVFHGEGLDTASQKTADVDDSFA